MKYFSHLQLFGDRHIAVCNDLTATMYAENVKTRNKKVYLYEVHERPKRTVFVLLRIPNTKNCKLIFNVKYNKLIFLSIHFSRENVIIIIFLII